MGSVHAEGPVKAREPDTAPLEGTLTIIGQDLKWDACWLYIYFFGKFLFLFSAPFSNEMFFLSVCMS